MPHAGEVGAGDELDLVEDHEGEQEVVVEGAEDGHHHGGADGEAFLEPQKTMVMRSSLLKPRSLLLK